MEINQSSLILVFPNCGKLHLLELSVGMLTTKLTGNLMHLKGSMLKELLFQTRFSHEVGQSSFGEVQTEFRADTKKPFSYIVTINLPYTIFHCCFHGSFVFIFVHFGVWILVELCPLHWMEVWWQKVTNSCCKLLFSIINILSAMNYSTKYLRYKA